MNYTPRSTKEQAPETAPAVGSWALLPPSEYRDAIDAVIGAELDRITDRLRGYEAPADEDAGLPADWRAILAELDLADAMTDVMRLRPMGPAYADETLAAARHAARVAADRLRTVLADPELATCPACDGPTGLRPDETPGDFRIICRDCRRSVATVVRLEGNLR